MGFEESLKDRNLDAENDEIREEESGNENFSVDGNEDRGTNRHDLAQGAHKRRDDVRDIRYKRNPDKQTGKPQVPPAED